MRAFKDALIRARPWATAGLMGATVRPLSVSLLAHRHLSNGTATDAPKKPKAIIFDLGGVVLGSPFEAIAKYEAEAGLAENTINKVIGRSEGGAFQKLETGQVSLEEFLPLFEKELKEVANATINASKLFAGIHKAIVPHNQMIEALDCIRAEGIKTVALTNNWRLDGSTSGIEPAVTKRFDLIVESAKEGMRKPDPAIYKLTLEKAGVAPSEVLFLDDIGRNLKPAKEMGMETIKVDSIPDAIKILEKRLGFPLSGYVKGTTAVRKGHKIDSGVLSMYMELNGCSGGHLNIRQFAHGQSNPTFYVRAEDGHQYVLRKKPPGKLLKGAHQIEREYTVMKALGAAGVPVPRMVDLCEDTDIIGTPFYLMNYINGRIFKDPRLPGLTGAQRQEIYAAQIGVLAQLHDVDINKAGLQDYGKHSDYFGRQIKTWTLQSQASIAPKPGSEAALKQDPGMEYLIDWLPANIPAQYSASVVHGDFRLDNLMFDPKSATVVAILDWELSTLGDPMADVAYSCLPYYLPSTIPKLPGLANKEGTLPEGVPTELQYITEYCKLRNLDVDNVLGHWNFYVAFSFFRIAAILQGVARRAADGQASSQHAKEVGGLAGFMAKVGVNASKRPPMSATGSMGGVRVGQQRGMHTHRNLDAAATTTTVSGRAGELHTKLLAFMDEHIYPNEPILNNHQFSDKKWTILPLLEELKEKAKAQGLWNLFLPLESDPEKKYGAGLTNWEYAHLCEITGRSLLAPEIFNCGAPDTGNMEVLVKYGTEAQKQQWLTPLLDGTIRSCFAMTEPAVASSDATNIQSSIRRDGDHYVINGHKHWISGAMDPRCKISIFMGKTDPNAPKHQQQSMILVPMDTPGVQIVRPYHVLGFLDAPHGHAEIIYKDVRVPKENILLGEGRGFEIAQGRLGPGRIHHCMRLIGHAERALDLMCKRVQTRVAFGKTLSKQGSILQDIAWSRAEIDQARLLTLRAAYKMDTVGNKEARDDIAMIKFVAPNMAMRVLDRAMQAHGGLGLSSDLPMAQMYAWARTLRLADGPDEVHLTALAKQELARHPV
eukprot:comp23337_c0_seq1/m.38473 comp23337_c0_seq1/g.38473  ORF comp23337_c0_seq1/g.38473 comp23337_c0_seq1/m.38473 type:complete len:1053 (-) comp23337_c0_seq1:121-3279(-)